MAPSVAETVSHTADQIQEKVSSLSFKDDNETKHEAAPAVQEPEVYVQHKEPLKLSGALDHFESFDVTPPLVENLSMGTLRSGFEPQIPMS